MLYVLYGADTYRSRAKLQNILQRFSIQPDYKSRLFSIEAEYFDPEQLKELVGTRPLFGGTIVVVGRQLLDDPARETAVCEMLPAIAASSNLFFFLEGELKQRVVNQLKAHAKEIQEFPPLPLPSLRRWLAKRAQALNIAVPRHGADMLIQKYGADLFALEQALTTIGGQEDNRQNPRVTAGDTNLFTVTDAIFGGTRRRAWIALQNFLCRGGSAEELFWKFMWQVKNIIVVKQLSDAGRDAILESGLHSFVAKKCLRLGAKFEYAALYSWWEELINLWRESRIGKYDLRVVVERAVFRLHSQKPQQ